MINKRFGILKLLGEGRSKVFLCVDAFFPSQKFAMKILPFNVGEEEEQTFFHEYNLLRKFSHPNIIKAFESGTILVLNEAEETFGIEKGSRFFVLEFYDGKELTEIDFSVAPDLLSNVAGQLSSFLSYLHLANYIYLDLKLENIICVQTKHGIVLKIVDYGLTQKAGVPVRDTKRGTASYLAPEILQNEKIDCRADLYSLGILLYRLVYGKFPFTVTNELEIYRAQLEEEFIFPKSTSFPQDMIDVIELLLKKNPTERIQSALQIFFMLQLPIENYFLNLISAAQFIERKNDLAVIADYLDNKERNEILVLQGMQNSGKSCLADKLAGEHQDTILIRSLPVQHPELMLRYILLKIFFTPFVHKTLSEEGNGFLFNFDEERSLDTEAFIGLFSQISKTQKFTLLLDNVSQMDEAVKEVLLKILPVLQVNDCKIILFEDQTIADSSGKILNKTVYQLSPFLPKEIPIFLKKNFSDSFPQQKVLPLIKKYADLFPGNILLFINELIAKNIIIVSREGIFVDENKAKKFSGASQNSAFKKRLSGLTDSEKEILQALSSFEVDLTIEEAISILKKFNGEAEEILTRLQKQNLIRINTSNLVLQFSSIGLKNFVYTGLLDKVERHKKIAESISLITNFSPREVSRHFELAEEYDNAYLCLRPEIDRASRLSAFIYATKIFLRLLKLPLSPARAVEVRKEFLQILQKTGDNELALQIINELETFYGIQIDAGVLIKKGIFLIASGEVDSGKKILLKEAEKLQNGFEKTELLLEIANANLNTNQYNDAQSVLDQLIKTENLTHEQKGKIFNLGGLLALYKNNDTDKAFSSFVSALKEFTHANLKQRIARVHVNLGNICSMKGNYRQAEEYWKSSLFINNSIGDLEQEALLLMNFGIYLFDTAKYEQAVESYQNAKQIFQAIGKKNGYGLSLLNSAETHLMICEYSSSLEELTEAVSIFQSTGNKEEEAGTYYQLAKTLTIVGDLQTAKVFSEQYRSIILKEQLSEKHHLQLKFLLALTAYYNENENLVLKSDELLSLCNALLETDNKYDAVLASFIYVNHCLKKREDRQAHNFLVNEKFQDLCSNNNVYRAVRLYLLGQTAKNFRFDERSFIDYLNEAYDLIKQESITEFTGLIPASLGKIYFERNLFSKAKEFFNLTEGLILFLSNNISDTSLRKTYLAGKERSEVLQFIKDSLSQIA